MELLIIQLLLDMVLIQSVGVLKKNIIAVFIVILKIEINIVQKILGQNVAMIIRKT